MIILPLPRSPGEHGSEEAHMGPIARARRALALKAHIGVNGFIGSALLIQAVSIAGVMPAQVWVAQPGYALIVCFGLIALSACILLALRSLLTQAPQVTDVRRLPDVPQVADVPQAPDVQPPEPERVDTHIESGAPLEKVDVELETPAAPQRSAPTALVIQHNLTTRLIIEKSLAKAGIAIECVDGESSAARALIARSFDLIIFDASALGMDRASVQRSGAGIPGLALTADKTSDAGRLSVDAIVAMPIVPDELAHAASRLIGLAPAATQRLAPAIDAAQQRELPKIEPEPLDERALGDLEKLGGRDFVRDIVAQFVGDAAVVLANLSAAVSARDMKAFREEAHALRSCAANVGAQNVYRMCLAWRDLDSHEIAASGGEYMQILEAEFERVRNALVPMLSPADAHKDSSSEAA